MRRAVIAFTGASRSIEISRVISRQRGVVAHTKPTAIPPRMVLIFDILIWNKTGRKNSRVMIGRGG
jgi:hypothetical protein